MAQIYKIGQTIGKITIVSDVESEKYKKYLLRCNVCGKEFVSYSSGIRYRENGCIECCRKLKRIKAVESEIGKVYNNFKVLGVDNERTDSDASDAIFVKCQCLKCQSETTVKLSYVKRGTIKECAQCAKKYLDIGHDYIKKAAVDGTSVIGMRRHKVNKNSTTGYNGVSQYADGCYRVYINFKRKQYGLGTYHTLRQAVDARKKAEKKIYGNFLKWYAETYPEMWEKLNRKKSETNKEKPQQ